MFTLLYNDILLFTTYGKCLIYGDFNSRTGNLSDIIEMDYDDMDRTCMLDISYDIVDFINKRSSLDNNINEYDRKLITLCQTTDSVIVNGRTVGDISGKMTCHTHNGSSLIDYVLCSHQLFSYIDLKVGDLSSLSDHCLISTEITIPCVHTQAQTSNCMNEGTP